MPPSGYLARIDALFERAPSWDSNVLCWGDGETIDVQVWTHRMEIEDIAVRIQAPSLYAKVETLAQQLDATTVDSGRAASRLKQIFSACKS